MSTAFTREARRRGYRIHARHFFLLLFLLLFLFLLLLLFWTIWKCKHLIDLIVNLNNFYRFGKRKLGTSQKNLQIKFSSMENHENRVESWKTRKRSNILKVKTFYRFDCEILKFLQILKEHGLNPPEKSLKHMVVAEKLEISKAKVWESSSFFQIFWLFQSSITFRWVGRQQRCQRQSCSVFHADSKYINIFAQFGREGCVPTHASTAAWWVSGVADWVIDFFASVRFVCVSQYNALYRMYVYRCIVCMCMFYSCICNQMILTAVDTQVLVLAPKPPDRLNFLTPNL